MNCFETEERGIVFPFAPSEPSIYRYMSQQTPARHRRRLSARSGGTDGTKCKHIRLYDQDKAAV
jgi:hypothetical protein